MPLAIQVQDLTKTYLLGERKLGRTVSEALGSRRRNAERRRFDALRDVSFEVHEGEVLGVIGRNGAGKSTLLKILARITAPTSGSARTRGRVGALLEVGTAFHEELTGRENVFINGMLLGMSRRDIRARFDDIVEFAGIGDFLDTPLKRYSSGMHMRLAFAVAAHVEPEIVVVDEVLAVGDAEFQKRCLGRMSELGREGRTVIFVSHDVGAIGQLCSRALWLDRGVIVDQGEAHAVVGRYLTEAVPAVARRELAFDPERPTPVHLHSVSLIDPAGLDVGIPSRGDALAVALEIENREAARGLEVAIWLLDGRGERVLDESLFDDPACVGALDHAGPHAVSLRLPPILPAGEYTLGVWIGSSAMGALRDTEVLRFQVVARPDDRAEMATRRRTMSPVVEWSVR